MSLEREWTTYTDWLNAVSPQQYALLNPGASDTDIELLKSTIPFVLPDELIQLYKINNGQRGDYPYQGSVFMDLTFLDIPNLIGQYHLWQDLGSQELNPGETFADYFNYEAEGGGSSPEATIKITYITPGWIPLWYDGGGNHIGIDLNPDTSGTYGQVINFGRDEKKKFVIAKSLTLFFALINQQIREGQAQVLPAKEHGFGEEANYYLMCLGDPLTTNITEALRKIVTA